ncbi:MAG: hypothetical protein IJL75_03495 [Eubacterium sp.]|nr:hypothetical protein [Eubacterium sp.]
MKNNNTNIKNKHHLTKTIAVLLSLSLAISSINVGVAKADQSPALKVVNDDASEEAKTLLGLIKECVKYGIDTSEFRTSFNAAEENYIGHLGSSDNVIEVLDTLLGLEGPKYKTTFNELQEVINLAYEFEQAVTNAESIVITSTTIGDFKNAMSAAISKYNEYKAKYESARTASDGILDTCLPSTKVEYILNDKTAVIEKSSTGVLKFVTKASTRSYLERYRELLCKYNVEVGYEVLVSASCSTDALETYGLDDATEAQILEFVALVEANGGEETIEKLNGFNGDTIKKYLEKFKNVKNFRDALKNVEEYPSNGAQMKVALFAYSLYEGLTEAEKKMVSASDKNALDRKCLTNTGINALVEQIDAIEYATDDKSYATFTENYIKAYNAYKALLTKFDSLTGVERLISNREKLLDEFTKVKDLIDRIKTCLNASDIEKCGLYTVDMTRINNDYNAMTTDRKSRIYNWSLFVTLFTDTKSAYDLRIRVDKLMLALTAEDETELKSIRSDLEELKNKPECKAYNYFGQTYENKLAALEYSLYNQMKNNASKVMELIDRIGTVTAKSGNAIVKAESAYAALAPSERELVTNYATLLSARAKYDQLRIDLANASVTNIKTGYVYTHAKIKPVPVVKVDGVTLTKGIDYSVSYTSNKNVGKATVVITALETSEFKGTFKKTFKIVKDSIAGSDSGVQVSKVSSKYKYTGKKVKPVPKVTIKISSTRYTLKKGTDYTLSYKNNVKKGTATLTIKGKGNYKGTRTVKYKIVK